MTQNILKLYSSEIPVEEINLEENNEKGNRKNSALRAIKAMTWIVCLLIVSLAVLVGIFYSQFSAGPQQEGDGKITLQEYVQSALNRQDTVNILLMGLDTRDPKQLGNARSDVMLMVTLDNKNQKIKLTSFMRDILVDIPDHDKNRINTAILDGGPDLAVQVVEDNFGVHIDYYAVVNFWTVAECIDILGGVDIDVKADEVEQLNISLREVNLYSTNGKISPDIKKAGVQSLDGRQSVAYMRIRHTGNGDFERTQRQRTIMKALMGKVGDMSLTSMLRLASLVPNYSRTNIPTPNAAKIAMSIFGLRHAAVEELRIPVDGSYTLGTYQKMSIIQVDFSKNRKAMEEFLKE